MASTGPSENAASPASAAPKAQVAARRLDRLYRAAALGDIVSILMRAPKHRAMTLDALRVHVLPAIMHNQFRIARMRRPGNVQGGPAGFAMWASVSDAVDQRLRSGAQQPIRLSVDEWRSGPKLWLIDLVAPSAIAADMLREIGEKVGKGRPISTMIVAPDGGMVVTTVAELLEGLKKTSA